MRRHSADSDGADTQSRVPFDELRERFERVLLGVGLETERASLCARIFAENSRDGVHSHGLNRFAGFVANLRSGAVDGTASPRVIRRNGGLEQWDGRRAPGPVNATAAMARAVGLAREHGIGAVGLANTSHWMRAGTYAMQAAAAGCVGICFTNTTRLMAPHGAGEKRLGNNPLAVGIPRSFADPRNAKVGGAESAASALIAADDPPPIVLDMAISQFSGGKLDIYRRAGRALPVPGGYDGEGKLTVDPTQISEAGGMLPIGFWKGSGLAFVLDLVAALLSGGRTTAQISREPAEAGVSQLFLAFELRGVVDADWASRLVEESIHDILSANGPQGEGAPGGGAAYPGAGMARTRARSMRDGVLVDPDHWQKLQQLVADFSN